MYSGWAPDVLGFHSWCTHCRFDTPSECIKATNHLLFKFIWEKKQDEVKRKEMSLDCSDGSLRAPNIELITKALKLARIARLLNKEQTWEESWKTFSSYFLTRYGGLNFLLKCSYHEKLLKQTNLPQFYKSMLQHFLEVKVAYHCDIGLAGISII